ncbi:MAG: hypothetical protein Q4F17_04775 [Eubacteriales bacterium]|nr:hypothetical protein [Eubacteriales bacterium]
MKKLMILGAGGYGKTVADLARQMGYCRISFLDDGRTGPDILGSCSDYHKFADEDTEIYPGIGNNSIRMEWVKRLLSENISVPTLIHPTAYVSPETQIGEGTVVLPMAAIATGVRVGMGCIINMGALIDHDTVIEDGVHLSPGAVLKAENRIPAGTKIESGQVIQNRQYPL